MAKGTSARGGQTPPAPNTARSKGRARQVRYTKAVASEICTRLAAGESWRSISKSNSVPGDSTFFHWQKHRPEFAQAVARARARGRGAGKPMTAKALQASARQMSDLAMETLAKIMEGDGQDSARLAAAREVLDRAHGKPKPAVTAKAKASAKAGDMTVIVKRYSDVTPEDEAEHDATQALFE